ncbi:MAG: hypothetical protein ACRDPC_19840 [Solirubrobacteraceae bacterium]
MRMLEERTKRAASRIRLDVTVKDPGRELRTFAAAGGDRVNWINSEHARLARPERAPARRRHPLQYPAPDISSFLEDIRSTERYDREVADYLSNAGARWFALVFEGAVAQQLAPVELALRNVTDENFAAVQVELRFPDGVYPFLDRQGPHELLDAPEAPAPWGTKMMSDLASDVNLPRLGSPGGKIEQQGKGFHVAFDPVHVRPHASRPLPPLHLAIPRVAVEGDEIRVRWNATSTSAAGAVAGELVFPVAKDPVAVTELVGAVT